MNEVKFQIRRKLHVATGQNQKEVEMILGGLSQEADGKPWGCKCHIPEVLHKDVVIYGEDQMDALVNSLEFCAATLRNFNSGGKKAWWVDPSDNGFPCKRS